MYNIFEYFLAFESSGNRNYYKFKIKTNLLIYLLNLLIYVYIYIYKGCAVKK